MADDQSSPVLSAGDDLLHRESVCGELGVRCDAGGPTTEAVHANMLRPSAPGLGGFRLSDRHQNATEGLLGPPSASPPSASPLLASPLGWHVRVTAVDALLEARSATICNNDSGMSSSLAAAKEANLLAGSVKESASLAEQVTATARMQLRHRTHAAAPSPRSSAFLGSPTFLPLPCTLDSRTSATPRCAPEPETDPKRVWQSSKGETNSAIGHALPQPHPSSSGLRSSVGSVGWPPQRAPSFLAQMPSPPPSAQQRSFSLCQQPSRVAGGDGDSWMVVAATNNSTRKCCYVQTCHLGIM